MIAFYAAVVLGQSTGATAAPSQSNVAAPPSLKCLEPGAGTPATGEPIDPPIKFQASPQATTRNFGTDREAENAVFKLTTDSALPKGIEKRLELIPDPILRVGDTTESASFPEPKFSTLRVSQNRKTISFRACLDPDNDLPAGKYVGTINLEGPPGVETSTVTITANAKDGGAFRASAIVGLLLAFLLLLYKGTTDERTRLKAEAEKLPDEISGTPNTNKKNALDKAERFWPHVWPTFIDPRWLIPTLFAVGSAFGVLWGIYDANPSWGESGALTSGFAVIGAGFAAVGVKTIFTGGK